MRAFLTHSGLLVALVAVALLEAAARALAMRLPLAAFATVGAGTFAVYAFDHLIDDAGVKSARRRFVITHGRRLRDAAAASALVAVGFGLTLPVQAITVLAGVVVVSLLHARLRHLAWVKPLYIALAWLAVVVGLPAALAASGTPNGMSTGASTGVPAGVPAGSGLGGALAGLLPIGLAVLANVLACDAADDEAEARSLGTRTTWNLARGLAAMGIAAALLGPASTRVLTAIPAAVLASLVPLRPTEAHTGFWVDGSLLIGALVSIVGALVA